MCDAIAKRIFEVCEAYEIAKYDKLNDMFDGKPIKTGKEYWDSAFEQIAHRAPAQPTKAQNL